MPMSNLQVVALSSQPGIRWERYLQWGLWGLFILFVIAMIAAQIYLVTADRSDNRGGDGQTPLAARGIAYVQDTLRTAAKNPTFPVLAIGVALLLGGLHAMSPGHNKVLTGVYLVSAGGRIRHAIYIGVATALSHTLGVIVIGALALTTRGQTIAATYLRWFGLPSGLVVIGLGVLLLTRLLSGKADHGHAHDDEESHTHSHGLFHTHTHVPHTATIPTKLTLGGLVLLGMLHGFVPTTDALAVLLVALSVKQAALGIALIFTYSVGIAIVMSGIGILFLTSQELLSTRFERLTRWMPVIAAVFVILFGLGIIAQSLGALL